MPSVPISDDVLRDRHRPQAATSACRTRVEPQPIAMPRNGSPVGSTWREFWNEIYYDLELIGLIGILAGLCLWFAMTEPLTQGEVGAPLPPEFRGHGAVAMDRPPPPRPGPSSVPVLPPFSYVSSTARVELEPALAARPWQAPRTSKPSQHAHSSPGQSVVTSAIERHAIIAETLFDPLGAVVITGLPHFSRLSAGGSLSDTAWAVSFADLDGLVVELPARGEGPVRTTLDLMTRSGVKIHSFSVELRQPPDLPLAKEPPVAASKAFKTKRAKSARPAKSSMRVPVTAKSAGVAAVAGGKSAPIAAGAALSSSTSGPGAAPQPGLALFPQGFFNPDPKDSSQNGLAPELRDDPRFSTLRGLGLNSETLPAPPAAPPKTP